MNFEITFLAIYDNSVIGINSDKKIKQTSWFNQKVLTSRRVKGRFWIHLQQHKPKLIHSSYIHLSTALTFALECALPGYFNWMHFLLPTKMAKNNLWWT